MNQAFSLLAAALLAAPLLAAPQAPPSDAPPPLFADTWLLPDPSVELSQVAIERRLVELDLDLLRNTFARSGGTGLLELNLFRGVSAIAQLDAVEPAHGGGLIWSGRVSGDPESSVLFSLVGDTVSASVRWADDLFRVSYAGNGAHWVTLVDQLAFQPCGTNASHEIALPDPSAQGGGGSRAGNPDIDVMVVYTTAAKNAKGGTSAMQSLINLAVTETNSAYTSSTATQQLVLVHTEEMVGYTEPSSMSTMLSDLRGKNDGKMDNVHTLRDQYAADCVSLFCANNSYCGIAYLMTSVSHSFESNAFNVVSYTCATGYYSFGHELGHNMGCAHDRQNASGAAYSYAYGFRTSNNVYRTIMAYAPGTRIKRFSSPNVVYSGYTMGTATEDNARCLNNTSSTVAGWRVGGPTAPVLSTSTLVAGYLASFDVVNCTPNGGVVIGYSTTGGGPTGTPYGNASLSPPILQLPHLTADGSGHALYTTTIPAAASGVTVWLQAVDLVAGLLSNGLQSTIL